MLTLHLSSQKDSYFQKIDCKSNYISIFRNQALIALIGYIIGLEFKKKCKKYWRIFFFFFTLMISFSVPQMSVERLRIHSLSSQERSSGSWLLTMLSVSECVTGTLLSLSFSVELST